MKAHKIYQNYSSPKSFNFFDFIDRFKINSAIKEEFKVFLLQTYFTAIQSLFIIFILSSVIGVMLMVQGMEQISNLGNADTLANFSVMFLFRELGPLVPFIVLAARSGSAMATELSLMKHNQEIIALESLNINPYKMVFRPRIFAFLISFYALAISFFVWANLFGIITASFLNTVDIQHFIHQVLTLITVEEFFIFHLKIVYGGLLIPAVCFYFILDFQGQTTLIPVIVMKSIVTTLVMGIVGFACFDLYLYFKMGVNL